MQKIIVSETNNERLDKYLFEKLDFTRSKIQRLIKTGNITVNGDSIKNNYMVKEDDVIEINDIKEEIDYIEPVYIPLDIVYEDDDIIVINKPSGLVVHPANGHHNDTLVNALMHHCTYLETLDSIRPGIVHRIDKDTSGLLVVAKTPESHNNLAEQIKDRKISRKYIALVHGIINHDTGTIDAPIGRDVNDRKKMNVTKLNSKKAITNFKVLERFKDTTLIECTLDTGRTHQIRVHMKYIDHPIVNDPVYGHKKAINDYGQLLHAYSLEFYHPKTNEYMTFNSDLPKEFQDLVNTFKD